MSSPVWTPLGPSCIIHEDDTTASGRVTSIAFDPADPDNNTIYVGAATGGVWKSVDGGLNWTAKTDAQETLGTGCIAIDHGRIIVGTGEFNDCNTRAPGMGVLVSTDNGDTWQRLPSGADHTFDGVTISKIVIDPNDQNHCFAATSAGLFETANLANAAAPWTKIAIESDPDSAVCDLLLDASDAANPVLYAAIPATGVFRRAGAAAFKRIEGSPNSAHGNIALALSSKAPAVVYAAFEDDTLPDYIRVFATVTIEGELGWERRGNFKDETQEDYCLTIAASPDDPQLLFAGGTKLWRSKDGGRTWEKIEQEPAPHADLHTVVFHPTKPGTVWAGTDGGVFLSTDGGDHWAHRNRGMQAVQLFAIAQHPKADTVILGGTQDNGSIRFEGASAWVESDGGDAFEVAIDPDNPRTWYYAYLWQHHFRPGPVFRSDNAGGTYSLKIKNLVQEDFDGDHAFKLVMDPADSKILYAGTNRLYISKDRGESWKRIKVGSGADLDNFRTGNTDRNRMTALSIAPQRIYVGTLDGQFFVLQEKADGTRISAPGVGLPHAAGGRPIRDVAVDPADPDKVYVAISSTHNASDKVFTDAAPQARLFRRDGGWDAGAWTALTVAAARPNPVGGKPAITGNAVNALAIDPKDPRSIYAGCDVGVFLSTDGGDTWDWWNDNLPNAIVTDLGIHNDSRLMRAATLGRGVWERPLDIDIGGHADIYLRDDAFDLGHFWRQPTPVGPNPFDPSVSETVFSAPDLKVDNDSFRFLPPFTGGFAKPSSTTDYTSGGPMDHIGFHDFSNHDPRKGADSRLYLQVNNRGPETATQVQARLFWANKDGAAFPDLPADFWTVFPNADPANTSIWHPVGPAKTIDKLLPAEPQVLTFDWPSDGIKDPVGVLAAITSPDDPINETRFSVADIVPNNNHVLLKQMSVGTRSGIIVLGIVALAGLLAAGGIAAYNKIKS